MRTGDTISHYRIVGFLGAGGMGDVYKAEDVRLGRAVALKLLPRALHHDTQAKERLLVEARAIATLEHPNICAIHEIDETEDGQLFLAMACYEGETLKQAIARGPLPIGDVLEIGRQVALGAAAAHDAGIIHRDIKPANIFLRTVVDATPRPDGAPPPVSVKLLDFGIAKIAGDTRLTKTGSTVGTLAYMAPEHFDGAPVDPRTDVWSIGVVLYEALTGTLPFAETSELALIQSIAGSTPRPVREIRPDTPAALATVVQTALQKDPAKRYATARELAQALEAVARLRESDLTSVQPAPGRAAPRTGATRRALLVAAAVVAFAAVVTWLLWRTYQAREVRTAITVMQGFIDAENNAAAVRHLLTLSPRVARDPALIQFRQSAFFPVRIESAPAGAEIAVKGYGEPDAPWIVLGPTPVEAHGLFGPMRWRVAHPGRETFEGSGPWNLIGRVMFDLPPEGTTPAGMVRVGGDEARAGRLTPFFIDRFEVTNREYKKFVDAGGYRDPRYWQEPVSHDGRMLPFAEATRLFLDATGRPGPAGWELGTYPDGQDEWPVRGISWYEAAAYARFTGKLLPTVHHWREAASLGIHSAILEWSNFSGTAPARVGQYQGLGQYGTYDMAGNVKEWCANAVGERRYILGGAWDEPNYQYQQADARLPTDRSLNNGVRLMQVEPGSRVPETALAPIERLARDYSREKPVSDEVFTALAGLYAYDRTELDARVESTQEEPAWRVERVSYAAAYGGERVIAYLFLPKNAAPPYQTVLYFPHAGGYALTSFHQAETAYLRFLIRSGRALLFPMYKGTYERRSAKPIAGRNAFRDQTIQQVKDVSRSMDYLRTRTDIAADRVAYFGVSLGAGVAPMALATDPRFKTAIFWSGGFPQTPRQPEVDPINFAPRVTLPVLMLNGRDDFASPPATSQEPMFRMLGTPEAQKRRALYEGGHVFPFSRLIKDTLDWLDLQLGVPTPAP